MRIKLKFGYRKRKHKNIIRDMRVIRKKGLYGRSSKNES